MLERVGFASVKGKGRSGFCSSPVTEGLLFGALKPLNILQGEKIAMDPLDIYRDFERAAYGAGVLGEKNKHLLGLAAALAAGCEESARSSLAAANRAGATKEELRETMAVAMVVGAAKVKSLYERLHGALPGENKVPVKVPAPGLQVVAPQSSGFT